MPSLGTAGRIKAHAEACKQHLRNKFPANLPLVQDFIKEIEGERKTFDQKRWQRFEKMEELEKEFRAYLSGE